MAFLLCHLAVSRKERKFTKRILAAGSSFTATFLLYQVDGVPSVSAGTSIYLYTLKRTD